MGRNAGGGSGGALAGQALGIAVVLVGAAWLLRGYLIGRGTGAATTGLRRKPNVRAVTASLAFIAFAVSATSTCCWPSCSCRSHEVGIYAALSTIGKVVMFLPAAIAVVMVPNAARTRHTSGGRAGVLRIAGLLVAITTVVAALPAILAPESVVRLMFGSKYLAATDGVLPIVWAGAGLSLLYLLVIYSVADRGPALEHAAGRRHPVADRRHLDLPRLAGADSSRAGDRGHASC